MIKINREEDTKQNKLVINIRIGSFVYDSQNKNHGKIVCAWIYKSHRNMLWYFEVGWTYHLGSLK